MRKLLINVAKLYSKNISTFGTSARSAGWKNEISQKLRFQKLFEVIDKNKKNDELTINDLGCGYGALYQYIKKECSLKISQYFGYDISEEMLVSARKFIKDTNAVFIHSEQIIYDADYSFASGIFNVKLDVKGGLWERYIKETLFNINERTLRGFAFNALTTHVDYRESHLYYADPLFFSTFCRQNFSHNISLLHGYGLYEWTIIVKK